MRRSGRWEYPRGVIDAPPEIGEPGRALELYERGVWDPAEQHWGEPEDVLEMCVVEVVAAGPRLQFEFEEVLPGGEDPDAADPILEARSSSVTSATRIVPVRCLRACATGMRAVWTRTRTSEGSRSASATRLLRKLTMRPPCGSPSARFLTRSAGCSAGAWSTTARSCAACTA